MMTMNGLTIEAVRGGTIYISGDKELQRGDKVLEKDCGTDGKAFVRKTNIEGIFTYGVEQTKDSFYGHGPGYVWASRASVMNACFGVTLYEACYRCNTRCYETCAIDLVRFEHLLKAAGYSVDFTPIVSKDNEDVNFKVIKEDC